MKLWLLAFLGAFYFIPANSQIIRKSTLCFYSGDSILITADHYRSKEKNPYIILIHQENSSRGVFDSIAERFVKMNYNCLAVDLRNGDKYEFVNNETAQRARQLGHLINQNAAENDLAATIDFIFGTSKQKLILLGSSSSASMALKLAVGNEKIKAVIALSPGEFYRPEYELKSFIENLNKPLFITGNEEETNYYKSIIDDLEAPMISLYRPSDFTPIRGNELLLKSNNLQNEYWFALLIFIKSLHP
jgi:dienelactone hydrolase